MAIKEYAAKLIEQDATLKEIAEQKETLWVNPKFLPFEMTDAVCQLVVSDADIADAEARLERFAPFIRKCFPETECTNGIIESPLKPIPEMQKGLIEATGSPISGNLFLKMDSHLAVAGSVKARGGIYEVLKHAEDLAIAAGKLKVTDNYEKLCSDEMRAFFNQYTVQVGSTGNLGLSIGISSAAIGFKVKVHMSADARQWKKDLLRSKGVEVIEYADDYSKAVAEGRKLSDADPMSYFVDDEKSVNLFLGYAVAASRLKKQLDEQGVVVDEQHPLIVYIPTGVGGAPGGVAYGLKRVYKNAVHCFFAEPTLCPSVLLGFATNLYENVNVHDFGIDGLTEADGLACASPSGFVTRIDSNLISGDFTIEDAKLYDFMRLLHKTEDVLIEPSSCAAFIGPVHLESTGGRQGLPGKAGLTADVMKNATQICWATAAVWFPMRSGKSTSSRSSSKRRFVYGLYCICDPRPGIGRSGVGSLHR